MVMIQTFGAREFDAQLKALGDEARRDVLLDAVTEAAEPMRARMEATAWRGPDAPHIAEHMAISELKIIDGVRLDEQSEVAVAIGPTKDFFYGWFLEFGWTHRPEARPVVRPAFDEGAPAALLAIGQRIWAGIARKLPGGGQ